MMKLRMTLLALLCANVLWSQQIFIAPVAKLNSVLDRVTALAFSSDGEQMVAGDRKGNFQIWDTYELKAIGSGKVSDEVLFIDFLRDDDQFIVIDAKGNVTFFIASSSQKVQALKLDTDPKLVTIDPEKHYVSYIGKDGTLRIFSLRAQMQQARIDISNRVSKPVYIGYDRFGQQLAVMGSDGTTLICNPANQKILREVVLRSDEFSGSSSVMHAGASNKGSDLSR